MTPTLETERLLLRPFSHDDADDVFAYASNPNVSRYTTWTTHQARSDAESFIERLLTAPDSSHTWAIRLRECPTVIGSFELSLTALDEAEVHYALAEPFWSRGLLTEAARTVVRWGWARYPLLRRISSRAMTQNRGSLRVMEKCGLAFERIVVERWAKFDEPVEQHEHAAYRPMR
jgi:ribosomal-protein-alanine N-acetyltransferase